MFSSMTAREEFRITGTVTGQKLETLLDQEAALDAVQGVESHISEAMNSLPAEDFLEGIKSRLALLHKNLRGDNRDTLGGIIEALDDLAMTTFYAADYGRNELMQAYKAISGTRRTT